MKKEKKKMKNIKRNWKNKEKLLRSLKNNKRKQREKDKLLSKKDLKRKKSDMTIYKKNKMSLIKILK